ncbi:MAG: tyrosine-type recombinase/integrase [Parvibaculales bacterium]
MATIRKRNGKFQAQVRRGGVFKSATFFKKSDAEAWARQVEAAVCSGRVQPFVYEPSCLAEIVERYKREITPTKKGREFEHIVLKAMLREKWMHLPLQQLGSRHFTAYKQARLEKVSASTFRRQYGLLLAILRHAELEWQWAAPTSSATKIALPKAPKTAIQRISVADEKAIFDAADGLKNPYMTPLIALAITSGLRRGELLSLRFKDWDRAGNWLLVREAKSGHPRQVPLFGKGLDAVISLWPSNQEMIFPITPNAVKLNWNRLRIAADLPNIRFHDLRHEAISRLFEKGLSMPEVASISGHRTPSQLFRYAHADFARIQNLL